MKKSKKDEVVELIDKIKTIDEMNEEELKQLGEDQQKYKRFLDEMEEYLEREDSKVKKAERIEFVGKHSEAIVFTKNIEETAIEQIQTLVDSPVSANSQIRIMPDVHSGKGGVIGLTMFSPPVIPNLIGVDLGCGVMMAEIGKIDSLDLKALDKTVREVLPAGTGVHTKKVHGFGKKLKELKCYDQLVNIDRIEKSLGTLGGGKMVASYYGNIV